jgi:DNA-binding Lrp family transcriptional regulator
MEEELLDDLDRHILHLLQVNARDISDTDIAEETGVTSTTVSNRIADLEDRGVIRGYHPEIDYERAGYSLAVLFICTVPLGDRSEIAEKALDIPGVVSVRETMASEQNLHVEIVARTTDDVEKTTQKLGELGLNILRSDILADESVQPWNVFSERADEIGAFGDS